MKVNQKSVSLTQEDIDGLAVDLESLQANIIQFLTDRERGKIQSQTIRTILQLANHLVDFYDD